MSKKILLHTCCGPCTTYVNQWLAENDFAVTGYFCNPNIRPQLEYEKRLLTMEYYATSVGLKVIFERNDFQIELGDCENCYRVRLTKTAQMAKERGLDCFSTTLLVSPYQNQELIKNLGSRIGEKEGINFFYRDFRPGFRQGQQMAKEMKLYRQKYCGCGADLIAIQEQEYAQVS